MWTHSFLPTIRCNGSEISPVIHQYLITKSHIWLQRLLVKEKEQGKWHRKKENKMFLLPTHSTLRSLLLQVPRYLQSHHVQQDAHLHPLSKGTLRDFPTLNWSLFYSQESGVANICNPSTSVKYLYKLHSPALMGERSFCLALHGSSMGDMYTVGNHLHALVVFLPSKHRHEWHLTVMEWKKPTQNPEEMREVWWKINARMPKQRVESSGRGDTCYAFQELLCLLLCRGHL